MQSTKEQVLAYLLHHAGTFVTGQALADQLNLSRESGRRFKPCAKLAFKFRARPPRAIATKGRRSWLPR